MPLLDTRIEGKNLVGKFISDIVLQVLSFVAENERNNIRERQAEGIRIAKEKGVKFGRPKVSTPPNANEILDKYINHEITNTEAASILGVSRGTFFRLVKERKCNPQFFEPFKLQLPIISYRAKPYNFDTKIGNYRGAEPRFWRKKSDTSYRITIFSNGGDAGN